MGKFEVLDHPLIQHKLTMIRDKRVGTKVFRETVKEISTLMAYEVSRNMPLKDVEVETPIAKTTQKELAGKKVAIIPILRAGWGCRWDDRIDPSSQNWLYWDVPG